MQTDMVDFQRVVTRMGSFRLTMKVGIAAGDLLQSVMGDPGSRLGYVLNGPALSRAAIAEQHAQSDEVVVDATLTFAMCWPSMPRTTTRIGRIELCSCVRHTQNRRYPTLSKGTSGADLSSMA
jgi:hypothetical protein